MGHGVAGGRRPLGCKRRALDLLFRVLEARRRRELPPALDVLHAGDAEAANDGTPPAIRERFHRIEALVEDIAAIDRAAQRLAQRALVRLIGLGGRASARASSATPFRTRSGGRHEQFPSSQFARRDGTERSLPSGGRRSCSR